jgi:hypothetical protein
MEQQEEIPADWFHAVLGEVVLVAAVDFAESHTHLHVDLLPAKSSEDDSLPGKMVSKEEALKWLTWFYGLNLNVALRGEFRCKESDLPEVIRVQLAVTEAGAIRFRASGGEFQIDGAPVTSISWKTAGAENYQLALRARLELVASETYAEEALDFLCSAFDSFKSSDDDN